MSQHFEHDDYGPDCWQCCGEGGWNSCMEDSCAAIGGEEGCTDPRCFRKCDVCKGGGVIDLEEDH